MHPHLDVLARETFERLDGRVVLAAPLGIGQPVPLVDAFYGAARRDSSLSLHIFTALSLLRPRWSNELERRLAEPVMERILGGYPDPAYARDLFTDGLPENVRVTSFYYAPGSGLGSVSAQRHHTSVNYTHVVRNLLDSGVNCLCQMVAVPPAGEEREARAALGTPVGEPLSLSSNPDLTLDLLPHLLARRSRGSPVALLGVINRNLPFMYGDAVLSRATFDRIADDPGLSYPLFAPPSEPVPMTDWALGLNASALIRDGGTIQLGIGALGDAVSRLLILRRRHNDRYRTLMDDSGLLERHGQVVEQVGGMDALPQGLHGSSEMLTQGLLELMRDGVIRRPDEEGYHLKGAFFLGPRDFYRTLRRMPVEERRRIRMTAVSEVNTLHGDEARKSRERTGARFLNTGMVATLLGAVASDGLEDGRVVSGVGGQYNFVAMAHELEGGRSVLMVRSVREAGGQASSNIRFAYGHATIPRHLRDLLVTEYGIADLRGCSDEDVVKRSIVVADSRFQEGLLDQAREAGKVHPTWQIPEAHRHNTPERLHEALSPHCRNGTLPEYPFGTELTKVEQELARALRHLKRTLSGDLTLPDLEDVHKTFVVPREAHPHLERMGLAEARGVGERLMRRAVAYALSAVDVV